MEEFNALSTPVVFDACLRLQVPVRSAPAGVRAVSPNMKAAGRVSPVRHYGSVDASLWFALAVLRYQRAGGEASRVGDEYLPALLEIAEAYRAGIPSLGIEADAGMLIRAGDPTLNPTWMDAKTARGAVTPRYGFAVEICALWYSLLAPVVIVWLLIGGFGLESVPTDKFGGFLLTLVIGVTGIVGSLPIGIALALGRQSHMPAMRIICVGFIEFIRGVPLITLLFVASTMLNYFLPPGTTFDLLMRVLIMVTLFSSAYIAEVIRGGLQAIPNGQIEAADAMGLKYWPSMRLIILPQALKISIPGIVNSFIGLYKDTTLVIIIGLFDPLGMGRASLADTKWQGLSTEIYVFVALFFFVSCFSMARYSLYLEKKLHTGH